MTASLPMYDLPELRAHTDRFWQMLGARLRETGRAGVPAVPASGLAIRV